MNLRIGYESRSKYFFIQIMQQSTGNLSTVFLSTVTGISNFINIVKAYEKITIQFDSSLTAMQKHDIRTEIQNNVTLP